MSKHSKRLSFKEQRLIDDRISGNDQDQTFLNILQCLQTEHNAIELFLVNAHKEENAITTAEVMNCIRRMADIRNLVKCLTNDNNASAGICNYAEWVARKMHSSEFYCICDYLR